MSHERTRIAAPSPRGLNVADSRFSLRTLLLFVTACSVACSWLAVKMQQAKRQCEAVSAIEEVGGKVKYDHQPLTPTWLRNRFGNDLFDNVVEVTTWEDDALAHVKHFRPISSRWISTVVSA